MLEKDDYDAWREHFLNALNSSAGADMEPGMLVDRAALIAEAAVEKQKLMARASGRGGS